MVKKSTLGDTFHLSGKEKRTALVVLAFVLAGAWIPSRIIVSISPSLHKRIFFKVPVPHSIKNNDYLIFSLRKDFNQFLKKGLRDRENDRMIKRVGCSPGNILTLKADGFYCMDPGDQAEVFLGMPLQKDSRGKKLPRFDFAGTVPPDSYFMVGDAPRSFDSRYFGFIHAREFKAKALPLL